MKASLILIIIVFLLFSAGCTPAQPAPDDTSQPTAAMTHTAESEAITTDPTIAQPTGTATQQPEATLTSPPPAADSPDLDQTTLDFSKYGPLAFIDSSEMAIHMISPDGAAVDWTFEPEKDLFPNDITWSADGSKLVLATTWDGITILSIADKGLINLSATNEFAINSSPSFSPDGKFITFFAFNEGAIYRINVDGTGLVNLTPDARYRNSFESPAWSPSGKQIVYSRRYADGAIYSMNADGSARRTLVDIGWNDKPRFSPDGRWLAFIRYNESQGFLCAMPIAGGSYRSLSSNQHDVVSYSWSPDGRYLVFRDFNCDGGCDHRYWMVEFETGETWKLTTSQEVAIWGALEWSPLMMVAEKREDCTVGWSRLAIGNLVQLIGNVPNRVRSAPQKGENVVGQFVAEETFILLDGPLCSEGLVWWQIADPRLPGGSGWTAEGDLKKFWLEPIK